MGSKIFVILNVLLVCNIINSEENELPCLSYGHNLTIIASNFLECALSNSRPLNLCKNCLKHYIEYTEIYDLMSDVNIYPTNKKYFNQNYSFFRITLYTQQLYTKMD
jgi:hypothetical protein